MGCRKESDHRGQCGWSWTQEVERCDEASGGLLGTGRACVKTSFINTDVSHSLLIRFLGNSALNIFLS